MEYVLMVAGKDKLLWVPLTPSNTEVILASGQSIHQDFRITVDSAEELQTKGQQFLDRLLFSKNNHLN